MKLSMIRNKVVWDKHCNSNRLTVRNMFLFCYSRFRLMCIFNVMPVTRSINKLEHNIVSDQHGVSQHFRDITVVLFCRFINVVFYLRNNIYNLFYIEV